MKIFLIFLATFLNITLLYLDQYYPFIIGLFLWFTLWFYSPKKQQPKVVEDLTEKPKEANSENIKVYEFLMILYIFGDKLEFLKKTKAWQKINIKYDDYIIKDALRTSKDNRTSLFKKYLEKTSENQKFYFLYELINLRHDSKVYIRDKQKDPIINIIHIFNIDFLKRRELINKAYYYLLKEDPFNERIKKNANKIHENIKNSVDKKEREKISSILLTFDFENINDVNQDLLKKRYKIKLSKKHPDKHPNLNPDEQKTLEKEFIKIQEDYNYLQEKLFY
jgi:hypothetical protein